MAAGIGAISVFVTHKYQNGIDSQYQNGIKEHMPEKNFPTEADLRLSGADYVRFRDEWMKHILGKGWIPENYRIIGCRLALYANFTDQFARPGVATVALDTGTSMRTVIRAIAFLEKEKLLKIDRRKRGVNRYFLLI